MSLQAAFEEATARAKTLPSSTTNATKLKLYGLFKQATSGPAPASGPARFDVTARAKWQSWASYRTMSSDAAMMDYISVVNGLLGAPLELKAEPQPPSAGSGASGGGTAIVAMEPHSSPPPPPPPWQSLMQCIAPALVRCLPPNPATTQPLAAATKPAPSSEATTTRTALLMRGEHGGLGGPARASGNGEPPVDAAATAGARPRSSWLRGLLCRLLCCCLCCYVSEG